MIAQAAIIQKGEKRQKTTKNIPFLFKIVLFVSKTTKP